VADTASQISLMILLLGGIIVVTIFIRSGLKKAGLPSLVAFIALGIVLRITDSLTPFLSREILEILEFMAKVGIVILLFRVGLESNLKGLLSKIKHASLIWTGNIVFSGFTGFAAALYLMRLDLIPSLFIGVAMTATSVGISLSVWRETGNIKSPVGELLIDVAEMDDISGILLLTFLLSLVPVLHQGMTASIGGTLAEDLGILMIKLIIFGSLCLFFSVYVEKRITAFFTRLGHSPDPMLMVVGFGFIITGLAALLGFSMAMGAFFAGLVFSRDPKAVKLDASMEALSDLFVPFFFIGIGLKLDPRVLSSSLGWMGLLLIVAVLGKLIGNGLLSLTVTGWAPALLISVSMIPRAEITMVIMQKGHELGEWVVPQDVFSSMVLVAFITSLIGPIWLRPLLNRCPQKTKQIETG